MRVVGLSRHICHVFGRMRWRAYWCIPTHVRGHLFYFFGVSPQVRVPTFLVPATQKVYNDIQTLKVIRAWYGILDTDVLVVHS